MLMVPFGIAKHLLGRSEETEAHIQEALRLSPRDAVAFTGGRTTLALLNYYSAPRPKLSCGCADVSWLIGNHPIAHFHLAAQEHVSARWVRPVLRSKRDWRLIQLSLSNACAALH